MDYRTGKPLRGAGAVWPWASSCEPCAFRGAVALPPLLAAAVRGASYEDGSRLLCELPPAPRCPKVRRVVLGRTLERGPEDERQSQGLPVAPHAVCCAGYRRGRSERQNAAAAWRLFPFSHSSPHDENHFCSHAPPSLPLSTRVFLHVSLAFESSS